MGRNETIARMILPGRLARRLRRLMEAAYPREGCALLIGRREDEALRVTRLAAAANVAPPCARRDSFELDPRIRFAWQRRLRQGEEVIVGHAHGHPDHPAEPSARDRAAILEPDLAWVIVPVIAGGAGRPAAFLPVPEGAGYGFRPLAMAETG